MYIETCNTNTSYETNYFVLFLHADVGKCRSVGGCEKYIKPVIMDNSGEGTWNIVENLLYELIVWWWKLGCNYTLVMENSGIYFYIGQQHWWQLLKIFNWID